MDYRWRLSSLGNSSTTSGSSDPGEDGRPELQLGRRDLFFSVLLSISSLIILSTSSVSLFYFILAVPMRKCLGKHTCMSSTFLLPH